VTNSVAPLIDTIAFFITFKHASIQSVQRECLSDEDRPPRSIVSELGGLTGHFSMNFTGQMTQPTASKH